MFKDYLNETKYTMEMISQVEDIQFKVVEALKALEQLNDKYNMMDNAA